MKGKKGKASGGAAPMKVSGNPNVFKEAAERKRGGAVTERKNGGSVKAPAPAKFVGFMTGGAVRPRLDRPGRKSGGRVGSNKNPLSTAHAVTSAAKEMKGGEPD